jgi:hypothetical protein
VAVGLYATERQICRALINAISLHPLIKSPGIYFPAVLDDREAGREVKISNWRLFGGIELIEPGLTLAVYPYHSPYKTNTGTFSRSLTDKSVDFGDRGQRRLRDELGRSNKSGVGGTIRLVLQLYYQESSFNAPLQIKSDVVRQRDLTDVIPFGELIQLTDEVQLETLDEKVPFSTEENSLTVQILPGEEILKDYIPLLRHVVREIQVLNPFYVRNPVVLAADYPTSSWIREGVNLIFHTAYILVEYDITEPALSSGSAGYSSESPYTYPKPTVVEVTDQRQDVYRI